ncbi:MAG: aspartate aminotransferase family protein [Acidobacteria bacterium]|nr:aspartate aminotransferase family protein [Acidobacteriota bacterium]
MNLASVRRAEAARLMPTYDRQQVLFRRGCGCYLYDARGRRYLDLLSGIGVNALGYGHPAILCALHAQAERLVHVSNLFFHDFQAALAQRLTTISGLERAFFTNSGTEAIEGALKLARAYARLHSANGRRPRWRILALDNSFHGRTFGALAATGQAKYRKPFEPLMPGVRFVRFNDCADLRRKFDGSVCAVLVEPIQGEGGIHFLSREFFVLARKLTRDAHALLIADEIQSGLGRTGRYFAYEHYGIQPDIVTVAKPLAAGLPLGAILARERVARAFSPGLHGTTFGGGPLACAVAAAFLDTLQERKLLGRIQTLGDYFKNRLESLKEKHSVIREVRGLGLMLAVDLAHPGKALVPRALARGLVLNCTHDTVLRFLPPYIITTQQIDQAVDILDNLLSEWKPEPLPERRSRG